MKIKFKRLDYQEQCRDQILGVFKGIDLREPENDIQRIANPVFETEALKDVLLENIENLRSKQKITQGSVGINQSLNCDILMETGTGKTFCFLECVYALHKNYHLSKFIVLVPSNAIKLGVLKSVEITREFFKSEYSNTHLESYEDIERFILASNHKCCVLVMTDAAFNKKDNIINQSCLENTNLFNGAKSYMQALASMRPIVIIDEPHKFLGDKTKEKLKEFNALLTLRFGATFKDDYNNLIYVLDSKKAFDCALVKSISVASVGESDECFLELKGIEKRNGYEAAINYTNLENKTQSVKVKEHDNLGVVTQISALEDYIVENITKKEVRFLNGFNLLLDQKEPFSHLLEGEQEVMLKEAIKSHFEREEGLFKKGIKALCMVFISGVNSYLSENEQPAKLALLFEKLYQQKLEEVLKKPLDENYRAYLERAREDIKKVHGGYFAKSKKESDEAQVIALILKEKEKLLSFDSDLRFIFSQWALQEGWDNPNVMTICKLAPSHSNITKLQQIGRGLRLAVNDKGERITKEHADFDFVNELVVIVPQVEGDFVGAIQQEISEHSLIKQVFSAEELEKSGVVKKGYYGVLLETLEDLGFGEKTGDENFKLTLNQNEFLKKEPELEKLKNEKYLDFEKLKDFLKDRLIGNSRVRDKNERKTEKIKINKENFKKFETLWAGLNHQVRIAYAIDSESLIDEIVKNINSY